MEELSDRLSPGVGDDGVGGRGGAWVEMSNFYQTQVILLGAEETCSLNKHIPLPHPQTY